MGFSEASVAGLDYSTSGSASRKRVTITRMGWHESPGADRTASGLNHLPATPGVALKSSNRKADSMSDHIIKKGPPLAYQNEPFLNSPDGRILRILSEYAEPLARFRREQIQDTVVFFGSARFKGKDAAKKNLTTIEKNEARAAAAQQESDLKRALAGVDMARYYEDARKLAFMLTKWT